MGPVTLVKTVPIMKSGMVAKLYDLTTVYVEDMVGMTGAVILDKLESLDDELVDPTDSELVEPTDRELDEPTYREFVDQTTGGAGNTPDKHFPRRRSRKARCHSGSNKIDDPINVGGRTSEATSVGSKKPLSSEGGYQTD